MTKIAMLVFVAVGCSFGCGEKLDPVPAHDKDLIGDDAGDDAGQIGQQEVVYASQAVTIKQILDTYCVSCHASTRAGNARNGATAGIDYDTYEAAAANAGAANSEIQSEGMPPSGARPTAEEKRLFQLWIDTGLGK